MFVAQAEHASGIWTSAASVVVAVTPLSVVAVTPLSVVAVETPLSSPVMAVLKVKAPCWLPTPQSARPDSWHHHQ